MDMSENDFYLLKGNSYRGSRYGNFAGGGIDSQGNVSSAISENASNQVGTSGDTSGTSDAPPTPLTVSQGLSETPESPRTADLVLGAALPYAGNAIGQAAGAAIGAGQSIGQGLSTGVSSALNKVSGGLIGTAASPTNIALGTLNGAAGPATKAAVDAASAASNVGKLGSGANLGAAAGSGIATAAVTLLATGNVKEAAKAGIGTAVGTAVGNAILPGVGGFVGGFIGGLFCFAPGTPILMADGTQKAVEDLEMKDEVLHGGRVVACGSALVERLFKYKNAVVSDKHSVFEDGKWIRVEDSELAEPFEFDGEDAVVIPVVTEKNLLINPWFISADTIEVPILASEGMDYEEIIVYLNEQTERNAMLLCIEKEVCIG